MECPTAETLSGLLNGSLSEPEALALNEHLAVCAACRTLLDQLSDNPDLKKWVGSFSPPPAELLNEPRLRHLLEELCTPGLCRRPKSSGPAALSFLEPARRPGDLGALGPYFIEAELGRGGMGIVLRGFDEALQRPVAVKVLRPELVSEAARGRLLYEAQAAARFRHEHVVSIYAAAQTPAGLPYLVMEYLPGPTLSHRLRAHQPLEPHEAVRVVFQVAEGLAAAHAAGLVHRDI
jgi:serine/threonine protein kinase